MTDFDDLKAMMDDATPRPDAARRAENLALAQKNFNDLQGSRTAPRPTPVTGPKGLLTGVKTMLNMMTSKAALGTTTALVACGILFLPQMQDVLRGPSTPPQITMTEFDGTITEPRIENEPLPQDDVTADMLMQDPSSEPVGEVLQEPLIVPEQDLALAPPAEVTEPAPELRGRTIDEVGSEAMAATPEAIIAEETAPASLLGDSLAVAPTTSLRPQARGETIDTIDRLTQPNSNDIKSGQSDDTQFALAEPMPIESVVPLAPPSPPQRSAVASLSAGDMEAPADGTAAKDAEVLRGDVDVGDVHASVSFLHNKEQISTHAPNTETFANADTNPLQVTGETPVSTFSIDVDTAAYSVLRSSLSRGQLPPANAIRIEELINYFPYDYAAPDAGEAPFRPTVSTFQTPWNADTQLVHIALQGQMPALDDRPPLNLVFLIDTSGSMDDPTKLPLLKQSFRLMLDQLRPEDEVAIVEYAGSAGQVLAPTAASERTTILNAIQSLGAGGSTNGQGGLEQAYAVADTMQTDGEVNRVILATDGDFNVGINNPDALKDFIADKRDTGTYLSVLGFGRGNLDDATMQALAQNGNGTAAYIDTLSEAQKVLVDQLSGALFPIAGDVKVQVEFNPAQVAEYRLIGYETRALAREDFNNDAVDAGELGAGHSVTAIYEITPVGSPAQLSDPLRYGANTVATLSDELGFLKLRYKAPGEDVSQLIETPIIGQSIPGTEANFAAAIAGFGQLLRNPQYLGDWGYDEAIALANANRGEDGFGYRTEAVQLMRLAQSLSR